MKNRCTSSIVSISRTIEIRGVPEWATVLELASDKRLIKAVALQLLICLERRRVPMMPLYVY